MTRINLLDEDLSLRDFLPESISFDPEIVAISLALDPELRSVGAAIIEAVIMPRIDEVPELILDELAWAFRLDRLQIWDVATVAGKRALLANIFAIRKKSGTRFAVRRVFDLMSLVGEVVEWFEEAADPYTYRIRLFVDEVGITLSQLVQVDELVNRFARAGARLAELAIESDRVAPVLIYPAVTIGRHTTISFGAP
jgi:phage tail P2-like protein